MADENHGTQSGPFVTAPDVSLRAERPPRTAYISVALEWLVPLARRQHLFASLAQVVAVGVDESGAVLRCPDETFGFGNAGVAFDGVEGEVETAGALEQSDAGVEQVVRAGATTRATGRRSARRAGRAGR